MEQAEEEQKTFNSPIVFSYICLSVKNLNSLFLSQFKIMFFKNIIEENASFWQILLKMLVHGDFLRLSLKSHGNMEDPA